MDEKKRPFPALEEEVLRHWEANDIFQKTLEKDSPKGEFVFYEGPPTANGKPGVHHIEARAFKDVIPRYRTMQGYHVRRKGGWDTHGLPVELEVEKQLGLTSKKDIERYGIAAFNAKCKESVWKYLEDWNVFTRRIGFWLEPKDPYITYEPKYVESLWAIIKHIWDRGLLYKDYKVVPWCPRCGTGLSSHELAQGYKDVKDLSVTAKFRITSGPEGRTGWGEAPQYLLAWTTTPWTLPGNVGLAVGQEMQYVQVKNLENGEYLWLAKDRLSVLVDGYQIMEEVKGDVLIGWIYEPLYPFLAEAVAGEDKRKLEEKAYRVYAADFVTTEDGTGIVHTAVMYGQDDFELGSKVGLPKHHLVNLDGTFMEGMGFLAGRFVRDETVAVDIIKDLAHHGLLFDKSKYEHSYPHCWRCKTPVIYYARDSWYIKMSSLRDELLKENEHIHWEPEHIRDGRFGEWLREVKDWAISRERYWGTPLPVWESEDGERICIGSFEELRALAKDPVLVSDTFDPHRPFVDDVVLERDGKEFRRVKEVMDVWFDSGAMPFAQDHYPFEHKELVEGAGYPADYISEAIDQTRGWFYTLHAVGVLMGRGKAFKNAICLGHLMDADGKKMSKSLGNVVDPWDMIEKYGVDALRWWMYTVNQPGESKNFEEKSVDEIVKKIFMVLWNVKSFYELYAPKNLSFDSQSHTSSHVLDRWILSRLNEIIERATRDLDMYRVLEPARAMGEFITDLSQWYVRRSRERFKAGGKDAEAAVATLRHVLLELSKVMAPFTPFIAERIYQDVGGPMESVHLEKWPEVEKVGKAGKVGKVLEEMQMVREVVSLALERRAAAKIPVRQPLLKLTVLLPRELSPELLDIITDEVNVKEAKSQKSEVLAVELDTTMTAALKEEGAVRELIRQVNAMRKDAGLKIGDRIALTVGAKSDTIRRSFKQYENELRQGTLASSVSIADTIEGQPFEIQGESITIHIQ